MDNATAFSPGQWVRVIQSNPATGGMVTDLMNGLRTESSGYYSSQNLLSFSSRVSYVGTNFIKLERALIYNVSTAWAPAVHRFEGGFFAQRGALAGFECAC